MPFFRNKYSATNEVSILLPVLSVANGLAGIASRMYRLEDFYLYNIEKKPACNLLFTIKIYDLKFPLNSFRNLSKSGIETFCTYGFPG